MLFGEATEGQVRTIMGYMKKILRGLRFVH